MQVKKIKDKEPIMKYLFSSQNESGLCRKYVSAGHMEGESPLRSNVV